jgi:hypothetical protein
MPSTLTPPRVFIPTGFPATSATTATLTGTAFALPIADSYAAILDVGAATGTSPTLDVAFQHSPDGGTHWYTFAKFAQVTATGQRSLIFTPSVAFAQAASEQAIANTGSAVAINSPVVYSNVRILATVGGTTPSFATINLWVICAPNGGSLLS